METIRKSRRNQLLAALLGTTLVAAGAAIGFSAGASSTPPPLTLAGVTKQQGFADLVSTVKPAVVNISTTEQVKQEQFSQFDE